MVLLTLVFNSPALAQDFYKDKTLRFIVGQAAGGGYDTYTRTIARAHRQAHPRESVSGSGKHDGGRQSGSGKLSLQQR